MKRVSGFEVTWTHWNNKHRKDAYAFLFVY